MQSSDWNIISRTPIFRSMSSSLARRIVRGSAPRTYVRNEIIFQQGDPAVCFFVVLEGWVKLFRQLPSGDEVVVALCTSGESFAEAVMFLGARYPVAAECVSPARLLHVNGTLLREAIMQNPQISFGMLAASAVHLRRLIEQIEQIKGQSAPRRVASFLLSMTNSASGAVQIALPYEKSLIAKRLGMKPESFSRAVNRLRSVGVVVNREFVHIDDVRRLATFAR